MRGSDTVEEQGEVVGQECPTYTLSKAPVTPAPSF